MDIPRPSVSTQRFQIIPRIGADTTFDPLPSLNIKKLNVPIFSFPNNRKTTISREWNERIIRQSILVNFWATWCQPCIAELPELESIATNRKDLTLWGIIGELNNDFARKKISSIIHKNKITYKQFLDPGDIALQRMFPSIADEGILPILALFDQNGELVLVIKGSLKSSENLQRLRVSLETIGARGKTPPQTDRRG